ncbi:unnamed protein product [Haemonchus placei]|uniref:Mitochondrial carrier protein n=1 Tax=Haemonchus placei TaxID=6290 RepID=A0A0N4WIM8_HAEPC|nr:unnamed protein product [Haemonchus placei]
MFMDREALIHFIGGAVGGTAGTCITCPLEVVKTRMQSTKGITPVGPCSSQGGDVSRNGMSLDLSRFVQSQILHFSHIIKNEGYSGLYKGLLPNLVGVAPSKAVYFYSYSTSKRIWNESGLFVPNSALVHMVSAGTAGFVAASAVNPIWLVKTRLQLYQGKSSILSMIRRVYKREGIRGFYKGVTASYAGVSETVIQFVIYEHLRGLLLRHRGQDADKEKIDFLNFMVAGGCAKFIACVIAYPHEVVRTRLREESSVKRGFFRILCDLYKEGGRAMYRGLSVQLMRTVPNTAITMGTYEIVVYMLHHL